MTRSFRGRVEVHGPGPARNFWGTLQPYANIGCPTDRERSRGIKTPSISWEAPAGFALLEYHRTQ